MSNDRPTVQFRLSIDDTDALRAMIRRDYQALMNATKSTTSGSPGYADIQRKIYQVEQLARIFSVELKDIGPQE